MDTKLIKTDVDIKSLLVDIVKTCVTVDAKADSIIYQKCENIQSSTRSKIEAIVLQWLRNRILIDAIFSKLCNKKPKNKVFSILRCSAADIMSSKEEKYAQVIHSWVDYAKNVLSKNEANFINAILRKFKETLNLFLADESTTDALSIKYSHQKWLIEKWIKEFGLEKTIYLLKLNQKISDVFFRIAQSDNAKEYFKDYINYFDSTEHKNFYKLKLGNFKNVKPLLDTPYFYVQDPSTFYAVDEFAPSKDNAYLDLCAAPGGKSRLIADIIRDNSNVKLKDSVLVSVDVIDRLKQLKDNLSKINFMQTKVLACDIIEDDLSSALEKNNLPTLYDGVFIDAPCSNTGVLRRRPDARYRLDIQDITECANKQLQLLNIAKDFVKVGGKLEYSTCSIEKEENIENIEKFLSANKNFKLVSSKILFPSENNDGAGHSLLIRIS